jgi:hypothetical protein
MLKVIDPVRWEAARAIFATSFSRCKDLACVEVCSAVDDLTLSAINCGWLAEVPDESQPPTNQWRPIAEAEGSDGSLVVGGYEYGDWTRTWGPYKEAVHYGYTHYLPIPEPPAREGE